MARLLTLTLLIGFFAFLPSAFADGENGLFCAAAILFVLKFICQVIVVHPVGCLVPYKTVGYSHAEKGGEFNYCSYLTNARHYAGNCGEIMGEQT